MIAIFKAFIHALSHREIEHLTLVRRYVDAQKNFIGELYVGEGRTAKMIGMSCDNLPFRIGDGVAAVVACVVEFDKDFSVQMPANVIRVGGKGPEDHASVVAYMSLRRYCKRKITILNRFVEHVLEADHV